MKRINKLQTLLGIIAFALVAALIFPLRNDLYADVSAPYAYTIDVVVTNQDGAKCKDYATGEIVATIPYGKVLSGEDNGYAGGDMYQVHYNGDRCFILEQDVSMANKNFDFSTIKESPTPLTQYIIGNDSCLFKGPREEYGRVNDGYCLPQGITVTSTYHDDLWMYVKYGGHAGWIYHYNVFNKNAKTADIATDEWSRVLVTTRGRVELKDTPYEDGNVIATIEVPPMTEIPVLYSFSTDKYHSENYISYGSNSGWYHKNSLSYDVAFPENENGLIAEEGKAKVSDQVDSDVVVSVIPANSKVSVLYTSRNGLDDGDGKAYVEWYNSNAKEYTRGWIDEESYAAEYGKYAGNTDITLEYDQPVFNTVNGKKTGDVKEGETYKISYYYHPDNDETWYYISAPTTYKDIGWIKSLTSDEIKALEEQKRKRTEDMLTNDEPEDVYVYEIDDTTDDIENPEDIDVISIILWLLIGVGIIASTIIVVLVIEKCKEAKNSEADQENDSSEQKVNEDDVVNNQQVAEEKTTVQEQITEDEIVEEKQELPAKSEDPSLEEKNRD